MNTILLLNTVMMIGELLMNYGAEVYRVEQTIERISGAYGATDVNVFAIPSSIVITLSTDSKSFHTMTKRIHSRGTDLDKIHKLNNLSRRACNDKITLEEIQQEAFAIKQDKGYSPLFQYMAYSIASASFALFFGGNYADGFVSLFIGAFIKFLINNLNKLKSNPFFVNVICSGIISLSALLSVYVGIGSNMDKITMGCLMMLVPGIAITNSMRDIINGDLISGSLKLVEAFIVAAAIAVGVTGTLPFSTKIMEIIK